MWHNDNNLQRAYRWGLIATAITCVVVILGAFTRLVDAGLGCPDWPGCYGHLTWPKGDAAVAGGVGAVALVDADGGLLEVDVAMAERAEVPIAAGITELGMPTEDADAAMRAFFDADFDEQERRRFGRRR